ISGSLIIFDISATRTPTVDTESKLGPEGVPVEDPTLYRSLGTVDFGLQLYVFATTSLVGFIDADWASCPSRHSAEAKYRGVANVVAETAWLHNIVRELHYPLSTATLVYCDNYADIFTKGMPSALFEDF
nr:ribonuclease H-like domain-containing protein [Tanacetum cinerariifolium]